MGKALFIAEKPSVAQEFAKALKVSGRKGDGYIESDQAIVTWCVGHLVTMSYPDAYDPALKRWSMETLPFLPKTFKYQVIDDVKKQFKIVSGLLNRADVDTIYVCTDSGREGEYIYRLVEQMAGVKGKNRRRVWIDSQTEDEILRGVREAKDLAEYDNLAASAYLRAKEDYLMGINLKYGNTVKGYLKRDRAVISVGRVMTCVLGMVVRREREIREFVKTPFYRVIGSFDVPDHETAVIEAEWRAVEGSRYFGTPALYKENGFKEHRTAEELIRFLSADPMEGTLIALDKKKETKNPPLLYNLAEIQNDCSKMFKISPDETLKIIQELYEKKLVTYPRTDARVLSTAVAKEIYKNIGGLRNFGPLADFAAKALDSGTWKQIARTKYVNDKQITDHYAIIPTGQGFGALRSLNPLAAKVYELIGRRFLSIFYSPAVYQKFSLRIEKQGEQFFAAYKVLAEAGYLEVANVPSKKKMENSGNSRGENSGAGQENQAEELDPGHDEKAKNLLAMLSGLKKGQKLKLLKFDIKEGEKIMLILNGTGATTLMELFIIYRRCVEYLKEKNIEIKRSGIGTSATRAEILKKLFNIKYLALAKKTQVITPTLLGEIVFDVCQASMRQLLNPELTASWEKGLTYVAEGTITPDEYMEKLERFVTLRTNGVKQTNNAYMLRPYFDAAAQFYKK